MGNSILSSLSATSLLLSLWIAFGYVTLIILALVEILGLFWLIEEFRARFRTLKLRRKLQLREYAQQVNSPRATLIDRRLKHRTRRLQGPGWQ